MLLVKWSSLSRCSHFEYRYRRGKVFHYDRKFVSLSFIAIDFQIIMICKITTGKKEKKKKKRVYMISLYLQKFVDSYSNDRI